MNRWTQILKDELSLSCCNERPFVCDSLPDTCEVIIIGENPATRLNANWWGFWDEDSGFNLQRFLERYKETRRNPGPTRKRFDIFRRNGLRCVETNVYRNERFNGAGPPHVRICNRNILESLIHNIRCLKGIIAHGNVAHRFIDKCRVPKTVHICKPAHFRNVSCETIQRICEKFRQPNPETNH